MAELVEKNSRYKHFKRQARFLRDGRCFTIARTYPEKPWMADLRGVGPKNIPPDALCFIMETRKRACLVPLLVDRLRASRSNWFTWPDESSKRTSRNKSRNRQCHCSPWRRVNVTDDQPMGLLFTFRIFPPLRPNDQTILLRISTKNTRIHV